MKTDPKQEAIILKPTQPAGQETVAAPSDLSPKVCCRLCPVRGTIVLLDLVTRLGLLEALMHINKNKHTTINITLAQIETFPIILLLLKAKSLKIYRNST
jgi:hypothetical protein